MEDERLKDKERRMHAYKNIDGTLELMLGAGWFLIGLVPVLLLLPVNTEAFLNFLPLVILPLFFGVLWFKHRVTYPRTGFVQPHRISSSAIALFVLSVSVMLFQHLLPDDLYLLNKGYPLFTGAFYAVVLLLVSQGLQRFHLYAAVALLTGIGALAVGLDSELGSSITALVTGMVLLISGGQILRRYLTHNSPPEQGV